MGYNIHYGPSAATLGKAAYGAGLATYQREKLARQEREQARAQQIGAQRARDIDYQKFQREQKILTAQIREDQAKKDFERQQKLIQDQTQRREDIEFEKRTRQAPGFLWRDTIEQVPFDDMSSTQMNEYRKLNNDVMSILTDERIPPEKKMDAVNQARIKMQDLISSVIPKRKTQADQWAEEGTPIGGVWKDAEGNTLTRNTDGQVKMLKKSERPSLSDKISVIKMFQDDLPPDATAEERMMARERALAFLEQQTIEQEEGPAIQAEQPQQMPDMDRLQDSPEQPQAKPTLPAEEEKREMRQPEDLPFSNPKDREVDMVERREYLDNTTAISAQVLQNVNQGNYPPEIKSKIKEAMRELIDIVKSGNFSMTKDPHSAVQPDWTDEEIQNRRMVDRLMAYLNDFATNPDAFVAKMKKSRGNK